MTSNTQFTSPRTLLFSPSAVRSRRQGLDVYSRRMPQYAPLFTLLLRYWSKRLTQVAQANWSPDWRRMKSISQCTPRPIFKLTFLIVQYRNRALTDPLIAGIAKGSEAYKLVGSYVTSPLRWCAGPVPCVHRLTYKWTYNHHYHRAVITGHKPSAYNQISDLQGSTIGISRNGRWASRTQNHMLLSRVRDSCSGIGDVAGVRRWRTSWHCSRIGPRVSSSSKVRVRSVPHPFFGMTNAQADAQLITTSAASLIPWMTGRRAHSCGNGSPQSHSPMRGSVASCVLRH